LNHNESFALINGAKEVIKKVNSKPTLKKKEVVSSGSDEAIRAADNAKTGPLPTKSYRSSTGFGGMMDKVLAVTASTNMTA
jgi:hypothetical protein